MVLFGGSILCGGDILVKAINNNIAEKYIIVGGAGHTTPTLRKKMHETYPQIETDNLQEAEIFNCYLKLRYSIEADFIEIKSKNCGNNITCLLDLIKKNNLICNNIIISQDVTMQHRMEAGLRKYCPNMNIINFATYKAIVKEDNGILSYTSDIWEMWDIDRYISLLLGEIPRLTDDKNGYGPNGKDFIAHVEIPENIRIAFEKLKESYSNLVREANPEFATVK